MSSSQSKRRYVARIIAFLFGMMSLYGADRPLPESVEIVVLAKLEPDDLRLFVRVPLAAIRDIQLPLKGEAGYLDLNSVRMVLPGAAKYWIQNCFEVFKAGEQVPDNGNVQTRISPLSDESFRSYESVKAHFAEPPMDSSTKVFGSQVWVDAEFEYPLEGALHSIAILPKPASLGAQVSTRMQYVSPDNSVREFVFEGNPGLVYFNPGPLDLVKQFVGRGFFSAVQNVDFLLFIFCLMLPFRSLRQIRLIGMAFAASVTVGLLTPALDLFPQSVWFLPLVQATSALMIMLAALANIVAPSDPRRRSILAACGGLVYGVLSCFDLSGKIQFGGPNKALAACAYWLGLLLAAAATMAVLTLVLPVLFRFTKTRRLELIVVSGLAADVALGWFQDRWLQLRKVPWRMPVFDAHFFAVLLEILAVLLVGAGLMWLLNEWNISRSRSVSSPVSPPPGKDVSS